MANMKIWILGSLTTALMVAMIPGICNSQTIEQRDYTFKMEITKDVPITTFVLGEFIRARHLRPPAELPVAIKNIGKLSIRMGPAKTVNHGMIKPILFDYASSRLTEQAKEKILISLGNKADRSTPLQITGFTCDLGQQETNNTLAIERAVVVAELHKDNGYLVFSVTGKGKQEHISTIPQMRYLNRRVEIKVMDKSDYQEQ